VDRQGTRPWFSLLLFPIAFVDEFSNHRDHAALSDNSGLLNEIQTFPPLSSHTRTIPLLFAEVMSRNNIEEVRACRLMNRKPAAEIRSGVMEWLEALISLHLRSQPFP
jgi:hypothetical protein